MQERGYEDGHFVNVTILHPVQIVDFLFSFLQEAVRFEYIYKKKNPPKNSEILYLRVAITFNLQKSQMVLTCPILFSENGIIVLRLHFTHTKV